MNWTFSLLSKLNSRVTSLCLAFALPVFSATCSLASKHSVGEHYFGPTVFEARLCVSPQMYDISSGSDDLDADWEGAFQDEMEKESDSVTIFNFNYYTGRSIDDALEESTSGEIFLFVITCEFRRRSKRLFDEGILPRHPQLWSCVLLKGKNCVSVRADDLNLNRCFTSKLSCGTRLEVCRWYMKRIIFTPTSLVSAREYTSTREWTFYVTILRSIQLHHIKELPIVRMKSYAITRVCPVVPVGERVGLRVLRLVIQWFPPSFGCEIMHQSRAFR